MLAEYGFRRNRQKTYFMNRKGKREITGVVIDNNDNSLSLGRKKHIQLKQDIYNYLVKRKGNYNEIKGRLAHLKNINANKYNSLKETYLKYDKSHEFFK